MKNSANSVLRRFSRPAWRLPLYRADILLIDVAVAGLQFADKGAFRYPAGTQQSVFTHIVREYRKQQRVFSEAAECRAALYKVSPQQRICLLLGQIAGEPLTRQQSVTVPYVGLIKSYG